MGTTSPNRTAARTFGPFVFHPDCGELARNGSRIRLQPQPALVLVLLTDQPGKLISREEIYRAVWGEDTHVDFEQSLNYCIRQIDPRCATTLTIPLIWKPFPSAATGFCAR